MKALVNMVMNINTAGLAEGLGLGDALGLDLTCCAKSFRRPARIRACWKPTAPTCRTASTTAISPPPMRRRIPASPPRWPMTRASKFRSRKADARQYQLMIEKGLGELDKSGVAELTFKGRGK